MDSTQELDGRLEKKNTSDSRVRLRKFHAYKEALQHLLIGLLLSVVVLVWHPEIGATLAMVYGGFVTAISGALVTFVTGNVKEHKLNPATEGKPNDKPT